MRKLTIVAALLACAVAAHADDKKHNHYKWKDGQGILHYDDSLPDAALQFGYDVVSPGGMLIQHVDRARTAEEQKADKDAAAKTAAEKRLADEQLQHDQQLLAAYSTEQDLAHAQQAQLDSLDQEMHATQVSLDSQEKSLTDMLNRAADLERSGKKVSGDLGARIETQRSVVAKQKEYIAAKQKERDDTSKRFGDELAHYRELRAKIQSKS
jgi:hypothetical protein